MMLGLPFLAATAFALMLVAAPLFAQDAPYTIGNPDARLWTRQADALAGTVTLTCSHVVCPRATSVTVSQAAGPAHRPNPAELKRIANEELPKSLPADAAKTLTTATIQGFPAIRGRFTETGQSGPVPVAFAQIYLDGTVVSLRSTSSDPAYAPRAIDAVIGAMQFRRQP